MTDPDQAPLSPDDDAGAMEAWQLETQLPQLRANGQHDLAAALGERLLEIREAALGAAHVDTLAIVDALAESYYQISRYERAEALLERSLRQREAAAAPDPAELGHVLSQLAKVARARGAPSLAHLMFLAGKLAMAQKSPKQALFCLDKALAIDEKAKGRAHDELIPVLQLQADANLELGKLGAAEGVYRRIGDIYKKNHPPDSEWQGIVPALLGDVAMKRKAFTRAAELFEQALAAGERVFGPDSLRLQVMLDKAAEARLQSGDLARAEELSRRLLTMFERHVPPDHSSLLPSVRRLATVYMKTGDTRLEEMLKRTLGSLEAATREMNAETAQIKADTARKLGQS